MPPSWRTFPGRGAARRLEPRRTAACIATSAAPTGKVAVAPGGYKLNGRWSWCSGLAPPSQWIMIGGLVFREGEDHPDMRLYLVPVSEVKQDDTWYCAGLRATGSNTSVLDDVFVPEHRSVSVRRPSAMPARRVPRSTPTRSIARPLSLCTPMRCSAPALGLRPRRLMPISPNGRRKRVSSPMPSSPSPGMCRCRSSSPEDRSTDRCRRASGAALPSPPRAPITPACHWRPALCFAGTGPTP